MLFASMFAGPPSQCALRTFLNKRRAVCSVQQFFTNLKCTFALNNVAGSHGIVNLLNPIQRFFPDQNFLRTKFHKKVVFAFFYLDMKQIVLLVC